VLRIPSFAPGLAWRLALSTAVGVGASLVVASGSVAEGRAPPRPNVVLIVADDLGWGDFGGQQVVRFPADRTPPPARPLPGSFPYEETSPPQGRFTVDDVRLRLFRHTPHLDRLADEGIIFEQFLTHCRCSPTRAGLLTGRHFTRVGSGPETGGTLHLDASNIARDLQSAGYVTAAFGKWHNGFPNFPADGNGEIVPSRNATDPSNDRFENYRGTRWGPGVNAYGFDEWQGFYGGAIDYFTRMSNFHNDINWWSNRRYTPGVQGYATDIVTKAAVDFIASHRDAPFFCYVPMPAVHAPYHVLRSDLRALCDRFPGSWEIVRGITSPSTGRRIEDVYELRCNRGEEFDHTLIDPDGTGFFLLARGALLFALDRGVGEIIDTLDSLGLTENTIVWFMSDNGLQAGGASAPYRGGKGSLYEGGIRVPAVLRWSGSLDAYNFAYTSENTYPHVFQYLDVYPTTMSMMGMQPSADGLDGRDGFAALLERQPTRNADDSRYFGFSGEVAAVRTERWKLIYNEAGSRQVVQVYDLEEDPYERANIEAARPLVRDGLIEDLHAFMDDGSLAMAYFTPSADWISTAQATPSGEVLEVFAIQTESIGNGDQHGLFVRFATTSWQESGDDHLESTDYYSFDILDAADAGLDGGFFVTPARGSTPVYDGNTGVNFDGSLLVDERWPRDRWVRATIGVGSLAPLRQAINYIALRSPTPGTYRFFLDNVVIRRADGSVKAVIWESSADSAPSIYRHGGAQSSDWGTVSTVEGFPFSELTLETVDCADRCQ
jgi:arylsulfatase A-like enzyme